MFVSLVKKIKWKSFYKKENTIIYFLPYNYTTIFSNLAKNLSMIQRIQSVYLAISTICLALLFVFPFSYYPNMEYNVMELTNSELGPKILYPLFINVIVSILLALFSVLSFKNRKRQQLLNKINFLVLLVFLIVMFFDFNNIASDLPIEKTEINYGIGLFLPIVALICLLMANRAIKSDEKLIKSMDRIR
ncbi:MAG: glucan phosphoethanolaminetransferase (alkaline phosphatase superfamily) [Flavobacteriales bacterium]